uniref:Uncharacterized protein n=1 Tax=Oryza glumipatula TaxID=40148 RepID=A0A0D9Y5C3_9ORYZ
MKIVAIRQKLGGKSWPSDQMLKRIPIAMLRVVSARLYHHRLERLRKKMNTNIALEYTSISTRSRKSNGLAEENKESPTAIVLATTQTAVRKGGRKRMPQSNRKELQRSLRLPQTTPTALERICIGDHSHKCYS